MTKFSEKELKQKWAEVVAKAWMDEKFKAKLLQNPKEVLKDFGFELLGDIKILENTSKTHYLVFPEKSVGKLSENELESIAAAGFGPGAPSTVM